MFKYYFEYLAEIDGKKIVAVHKNILGRQKKNLWNYRNCPRITIVDSILAI